MENERLLIKNYDLSNMTLLNKEFKLVKNIGSDAEVDIKFKFKGKYYVRGCKDVECVDVEVFG